MNCPLTVFPAGVVGTVQYYAPCECMKVCEFAKCKYRRNGFIIQVQAVGATSTNTVALLGKKCGASMPLVAASTGDVLTNANLTAGQIYTVIPMTVDDVLRGVVQGL